jgi:hypothetical protein
VWVAAEATARKPVWRGCALSIDEGIVALLILIDHLLHAFVGLLCIHDRINKLLYTQRQQQNWHGDFCPTPSYQLVGGKQRKHPPTPHV